MKIKNIDKKSLKEEKKNYMKNFKRNPLVLLNKKTFIKLSKEEDEYVEELERIVHGVGIFYNMCYFVIDETLENGEVEIR